VQGKQGEEDGEMAVKKPDGNDIKDVSRWEGFDYLKSQYLSCYRELKAVRDSEPGIKTRMNTMLVEYTQRPDIARQIKEISDMLPVKMAPAQVIEMLIIEEPPAIISIRFK
jgi:hypothetical protein